MKPFYKNENVYFQGKLVQRFESKYKACASCTFQSFCDSGDYYVKLKHKHLGACFAKNIFKEI